jgi:hypothetical protein
MTETDATTTGGNTPPLRLVAPVSRQDTKTLGRQRTMHRKTRRELRSHGVSCPLLGSSCYVGSSARPLQLNLTAGATSPPAPNKPISGKRGEA